MHLNNSKRSFFAAAAGLILQNISPAPLSSFEKYTIDLILFTIACNNELLLSATTRMLLVNTQTLLKYSHYILISNKLTLKVKHAMINLLSMMYLDNVVMVYTIYSA